MISSFLLLVLAVVVGAGPPSVVVVVDAVAVVVARCRPGAGSACARQEASPGAPACCKQGADPWPRLLLLTRSQVRSQEVTRSGQSVATLVLRPGGVVRLWPPVARLPLLLRHPLEGELALVLQVLRLLPPHHLQDCQVRRIIILVISSPPAWRPAAAAAASPTPPAPAFSSPPLPPWTWSCVYVNCAPVSNT